FRRRGHGGLRGYVVVFRRVARAAVWASADAGVASSVLVCREDFLFSLSLYLGARDVAALPLRPTDGFRLEVSATAGDCESGGNGDCCRVVRKTSSQFSVKA